MSELTVGSLSLSCPLIGLLPHKTNSRQRRNVAKLFSGGQHTHFPRDRVLPGMPLTSEHRKLPVPPLGERPSNGSLLGRMTWRYLQCGHLRLA